MAVDYTNYQPAFYAPLAEAVELLDRLVIQILSIDHEDHFADASQPGDELKGNEECDWVTCQRHLIFPWLRQTSDGLFLLLTQSVKNCTLTPFYVATFLLLNGLNNPSGGVPHHLPRGLGLGEVGYRQGQYR